MSILNWLKYIWILYHFTIYNPKYCVYLHIWCKTLVTFCHGRWDKLFYISHHTYLFKLAARNVAQVNLRISHPPTSLTAVIPQQMKDGVILDNDEDWGGDTCKTALHASHFCLLDIICDDGGARKPFLLSLDKHENILTMSGTSRQLPGTGERNLQLPVLSFWTFGCGNTL